MSHDVFGFPLSVSLVVDLRFYPALNESFLIETHFTHYRRTLGPQFACQCFYTTTLLLNTCLLSQFLQIHSQRSGVCLLEAGMNELTMQDQYVLFNLNFLIPYEIHLLHSFADSAHGCGHRGHL